MLLLVVPILLNLKPEVLPIYSTVGAVFTVLGFFGWAITVLVTAPKADAKFVFTTFLNNSGYSSNGWVFILGFYNPLYGLYGTDSMMHLVEEMKNAAEDAPVSSFSPCVIRDFPLTTWLVESYGLVHGLLRRHDFDHRPRAPVLLR